MVTIGLGGGIGCGKSSVASIFFRHGVAVIDLDQLVHKAYDPSSSIYQDIYNLFGHRALGSGGIVSKRDVADIVFSDPKVREQLEAIIHPWLRSKAVDYVHSIKEKGDHWAVVIEIPLLRNRDQCEEYDLDCVVSVECDQERALGRLIEARGYSDEEAKKRMSTQVPSSDRLAIADYVIKNNGTNEELEIQTIKVMNEIRMNKASENGMQD